MLSLLKCFPVNSLGRPRQGSEEPIQRAPPDCEILHPLEGKTEADPDSQGLETPGTVWTDRRTVYATDVAENGGGSEDICYLA